MSKPLNLQCFAVCLDKTINLRGVIEFEKRDGPSVWDIRADTRRVGEIQRVQNGWHLRIRGIWWRQGRQNLFGGAGVTEFRTHKEAVAKAVSILRGVYEA